MIGYCGAVILLTGDYWDDGIKQWNGWTVCARRGEPHDLPAEIGEFIPGFTAVLHFYLDLFVDGNNMRESGTRSHTHMDNIDTAKLMHCDTIAVSRSVVEHDNH